MLRAADTRRRHEVFNFFGRTSQRRLSPPRTEPAGTAHANRRSTADRDADLPDQSATWKINVYAGQPREQRYQAVRSVIAAIRPRQRGRATQSATGSFRRR